MKKLILAVFFCLSMSNALAHIDRPIDVLLYDGKTYDIYSLPIDEYVGNNLKLKRKLLPNPSNPRLPKQYYGTFEIKDNKLYLNNIEQIIISDHTMRTWRFPLALNYSLKQVPASDVFGKDATYPLFCDWFTGGLFSTIFDGARSARYLYKENYSFNIEKGELIDIKYLSARTAFSEFVSFEEAENLTKSYFDKSFSAENKLFDLRCIVFQELLSPDERELISNAQVFKTRAYIAKDRRNRYFLYMPKTHITPTQKLTLLNDKIDNINIGDRVEVTLSLSPRSPNMAVALDIRHLEADEIMHAPDFWLRQKLNLPQLEEEGRELDISPAMLNR